MASSTDDRPQTADDVQALVKDRGIRFVRLWFTDILGQLKSFSIHADQLDDAFEGGMGFDGSSITGFNAIEESDMIAIPDPSTFAVLPWRPEDEGGGVARMFADIQTPERDPYEGDPAPRPAPRARAGRGMGFEHFFVGPELEYFLFRDSKGTEVLDEGGYFDLTTLDAGSDVRRETVLALERFGIRWSTPTTRSARASTKIDMRYRRSAQDGRRMHDLLGSRSRRSRSSTAGKRRSCPSRCSGTDGSGMHTHQSLFKDGRNAFYDPDDKLLPLRRRARRSSPGSCATPASCARSSRSG
jgi:glutamine synthetase